MLTLAAVASVLLVAACSDDAPSSPSATVATESSAEDSTTTTTRELTVEEQVEAAYLHAWDLYTDAMSSVDPSALEEAFAERALEIVTADVAKLAADGQRGRMSVEHNYEIAVEGGSATVVDNYVNHSVLLDADTGEALEPDPNKVLEYTYTFRLIEDMWKVIAITRPSS
jgi:hypothetical protein